jgi:RimJ/RimL family protein N-acetyltransferase
VDLVLREATLDDLPILFEHQRDPVANEMAVFAARDWDAFVANDAKILSDPTLIRRTVVVDDAVVCSIGCFGDEQREVGYWYDRAVWGRGIATAAFAAFLDDAPSGPCSPTSR